MGLIIFSPSIKIPRDDNAQLGTEKRLNTAGPANIS